MTSPTIPNVPFPPLLPTLATVFKDWEKHVQTTSNENVSVVPFKIVMFGLREIIYGFGYLANVAQGDVISGDARVEDEDYNFNPETAWHGGDSLGPGSRRKMPVIATLATVNGHPQVLLNFGGPQQFHYTATLTGVAGHDPSSSSAWMLTGDRTGNAGGKVTASFNKAFIEKTHWPPGF